MVTRFLKNTIRDLFSIFCSQTQKAIILDFEKEKQRILEANSRYIIEKKLVPYIIHTTLYSDGYLMTEKDAYKVATQMFLDGKASGRIDNMNRLVKEIA